MNLLITGGAGFIGSHTADAALAAGHRVRVLDDLSSGDRANLAKSVEFIEGDVADVATIAAAVTGYLIGLIALRRTGIYFAMITVAIAEVFYFVEFNPLADWTGGENGLRGINVRTIDLFGLKFDFINPLTRYYVIAAFVIMALFVLSRILASPFGAVIEAVRENEARARASGYNVTLTRLITFILSGAFCGLAGALMALHLSIVPIEILHIETSGMVVMMSLLGGMGTFFGPFVGAAVFLMLENLVSLWTVHWQLFVGAVFMICVLFFPAGIWGTILKWINK